MRVTMLPKVVVFLACLCVVKAGVFTVNAYEDQYDGIESVHDGADTLDRSVRNCVNSQCNSICRALGFARGVCISPTVCRCSGRSAQDSSPGEVTREIDQDPEEVVVRTTRSCGAAECNAFCRRMGYARGVCIGTYCQCRLRLASDVSQPEIENPSSDNDPLSAFLDAIRPANVDDGADTVDRSVRNCVNSQCNSICRALGFAQGVCISPTVCRCSGRRSLVATNDEPATYDKVYQEIASDNDGADTLDRSVRNCVNSQCNSICRALGFARGVCISPTVCRCSGRRSADMSNEEATHGDVYQDITNANDGADTLDRSVRNCVNSQCNSICRALGFARGVCISPTVCRCSGRRNADMSNEEATHDDIYQDITNVNDGTDTLDRSVRNCVNSQCNSICRALGFARGICISPTVCRCSGRQSLFATNDEPATYDEVYQEIASDNDGADTLDRSVRNCVNSQCNSICRALGFARGVCISPTVCRCSGRRSTDMSNEEATHGNVYQDILVTNANDGADTLDKSVRNCVNSQCNSICRALGFARGVCISPTVCRCSGRRNADISNEEATHDDIYQDITNANDGTDTLDRSVRNCVNSQCNSICRALGFARGVCISPTVCRCSGRQSLVATNDEPATYDEVYQEIASDNDGAETLDRSVRNCVNSQCNSICRALGFARGVCISPTVCRCSGRRSADMSNDEATHDDDYQDITNANDGADTLDRSVRNCVNSQCNSICRALGFAQGVCISPTVCRCSGRRSADMSNEEAMHDDIYQEIASVIDDAETIDRSVRNCVNSQCNSICRALGFAQGVCISPTVCRCSGRLVRDASLEPSIVKDETPAINEVTDKKADCNLRWCEQTCRRMGFPGGACANGRCKCDLLRSPPQTDNDVAANETDNGDLKPAVEEESNNIPQN